LNIAEALLNGTVYESRHFDGVERTKEMVLRTNSAETLKARYNKFFKNFFSVGYQVLHTICQMLSTWNNQPSDCDLFPQGMHVALSHVRIILC
jgi:hypothetical protein